MNETRSIFAPAERDPQEAIRGQSGRLQLMGSLSLVLDSLPEIALVLNSKRQILFANEQTLASFGLTPDEALGQRPGEIADCVHAREMQGGCGSSEACRHCELVAAVLEVQAGRSRTSRECRLTVEREGKLESLDLLVTGNHVADGDRDYTLIMMNDISDKKRRMVLERVFFHDVLNSIQGLRSCASLLKDEMGPARGEYLDHIVRSVEALSEEVERQRDFAAMERRELHVSPVFVSGAEVLERALDSYHGVESSASVRIEMGKAPLDGAPLETDPVLLRRVLINIVKNAVEASSRGERVLAEVTSEKGCVVLRVNNPAVMTEAVRHQVFQRSFSTKGSGRGVGTYSMRMLVRDYLKGEIEFDSRPGAGTTFTVSLPVEYPRGLPLDAQEKRKSSTGNWQ